MESLFKLDLDIEKEYIPLVNDLIRMSVIHIVTQLLFHISTGESFFKTEFLQTVLFVLLGICSYWLIIRKIVILE
tara:strand:- start:678 stop:902 length:225 start_codon:yes stop_codon:yes gene_type:complete